MGTGTGGRRIAQANPAGVCGEAGNGTGEVLPFHQGGAGEILSGSGDTDADLGHGGIWHGGDGGNELWSGADCVWQLSGHLRHCEQPYVGVHYA